MITDSNEFRHVMGHFATGVTVVTTKCDGDIHGLTVNAFSSVSLDPLLVLVNISKSAKSHDLIQKSGIFAVNFLAQDQEDVSRVFADHTVENRFEHVDHRPGVTGAPLIEGSIAYLELRVEHAFDTGDHTIFVGKVAAQHLLRTNATPLLYYRGAYTYAMPAPPEDVAKQVPRE